ncbi:MAG: hypothetical protein JWQ87_3751 [Candidatus Sulfotelmatobacter sp.]|nr:hypothetical protein [Candidatus Sulfotelmatobacter sp.]
MTINRQEIARCLHRIEFFGELNSPELAAWRPTLFANSANRMGHPLCRCACGLDASREGPSVARLDRGAVPTWALRREEEDQNKSQTRRTGVSASHDQKQIPLTFSLRKRSYEQLGMAINREELQAVFIGLNSLAHLTLLNWLHGVPPIRKQRE